MSSPVASNIVVENRHIRDLFSLSGKVALVTGGAGRYGKHISLALAEAGATVLIASRKLVECEEAAREFCNAGFDVHSLELDLTSTSSVSAAADRVTSTFRKLDVLVNNAVTISTGGLDTYSEEEWERVMSVNSTGLFRACKVFGGMMVQQGSGSIMNIGSIYGVVSPDFRAYTGHPENDQPSQLLICKGGNGGTDPIPCGSFCSRRRSCELPQPRRALLFGDAGRIHEELLLQDTAGPTGQLQRRQRRGGLPCVGRVGVHDRPESCARWRPHRTVTGVPIYISRLNL